MHRLNEDGLKMAEILRGGIQTLYWGLLIMGVEICIYTPAIRLMSLIGTPYDGFFISLIWAGTLKIRAFSRKTKVIWNLQVYFVCIYITL